MSAEPQRERDAALSPERWQQVRMAAEGALALNPLARPAFLDEAAGGDPEVRARAERLVLACERAAESTGFLSGSAAAFASPMIAALQRDSASGTVPPLQPTEEQDGLPGEPGLDALRAALSDRYVVEREIGRGGMATVFLAQDRKHQRPVAVKLLNQQLGAVLGVDRFLAEIQVMARLQHPNLVPLFDSGEVRLGHPSRPDSPGALFYVMPYVDGESLRARLRREGQLPVREAIEIATAVAGALDHAHRHGVVHRDLKPENILLHDGHALVADFGIALAVSRAGSSRITQTEIRLGTPQYMSPEQISEERAIDGRSDIFALGCVLYEMLAGDPPHTGGSVQSVIARILSEPPRAVRVVRPHVPELVEHALDRALAKLPADRFRTAKEFAVALGAALPMDVGTPQQRVGVPRAGPSLGARLRDPLLLALGAAAVVAFASSAALWSRWPDAPSAVTARFVIPALTYGESAITPDGRSLVLTGFVGGQPLLFRRDLDRFDSNPIPGTDGARYAVISPDGRALVFPSTGGRLSRVSLAGGLPTVLTTGYVEGKPSWGAGDVIALSHGEYGGLSWLSAAGEGPLHPLTRPSASAGETSHSSPMFTPDGKFVVFTMQKQRGRMGAIEGELAIARLDRGAIGPVPHTALGVEGRYAIGMVDDWLLYLGRDVTTIMAVRLDRRGRRLVGAPVTVLQDAQSGGIAGGVALSANGTLVYSHFGEDHARPLLVDSSGAKRVIPDVPPPLGYRFPRVSPDGRRIAVQSRSPQGTDIWIHELAGGARKRLTTTGNAAAPVWTPDGRRIVFAATGSGGAQEMWWQPADGSLPAAKLFSGKDRVLPGSVTRDGRTLLYQTRVGNVISIWSAPLDGGSAPRPVVRERFDNRTPALSPDGRWLAYVSKASGRDEVYVRPFPEDGAALQVSNSGAAEPAWSRNGERLYYRTEREMFAASISRIPSFAVTGSAPLFADDLHRVGPQRNYDVTLDGRFVMIGDTIPQRDPDHVVIVNWFEELRARLHAAR